MGPSPGPNTLHSIPMPQLSRPTLRAAGASAVLLAWLASLGWLAARRLNETEETTLSSQATLRLAPGTVWYALYAGSTQVGNAAITLDTTSGYPARPRGGDAGEVKWGPTWPAPPGCATRPG